MSRNYTSKTANIMEDCENRNEEPWCLPETKKMARILTECSNVDDSEEALLEWNIREMEAHISLRILALDTFDLVYITRACQEVRGHQYHPRGCHDWRAPGAPLPSPRAWPQTEAALSTGERVTMTSSTVTSSVSSASSSSQLRSSAARAQSPLPSNSLFRRFDVQTMELQEVARRMGARSRRSSGCGFCKKNGEPMSIYTSHRLHGDQGRVICPYLRELVCEVCGATGDSAHTRTYCPSLRTRRDQAAAIPTLLKATKHQSDGKLRKRGGR